jgi:hypothetical protein
MRRIFFDHGIGHRHLLAAAALIAACGGKAQTLGEGAERPGTSSGGRAGSAGSGGARDAGKGGDLGTGGAVVPGVDGGELPEAGGTNPGGGGTGGETGGQDGTGGTEQAGGSGGAALWLPSGSYDVRLHDVHFEAGNPPPSPSEGLYLRIDYDRSDYDTNATVTPRWGTPSAYTVRFEGDDIVLAYGYAVTTTPTAAGFIENDWPTLTLRRSEVPGEVATLDAEVFELLNENGDTVTSWSGTAKGDVTFDMLAPELRSDIASITGSSDALLPWEPLRFHAAEGVETLLGTAMTATITTPGPGLDAKLAGSVLPTNWNASDEFDLAGVILVEGRPSPWDPLPGSSVSIKADRRGVIDKSKHRMAADVTTGVKYLAVGPTIDRYTFESSSALPGVWGPVSYYSPKFPNSPCASGGCIQLGPFQDGACNVPRIGIAGRLRRGEGPLHVRYRVVAAAPPPSTDNPIIPFEIEVADETGTLDMDVTPPDFQDLGSGGGELHWSSGPLVAEVDIPQGEMTEVGVAVFAGSPSSISCTSDAAAKGPKTAVIIDRVEF